MVVGLNNGGEGEIGSCMSKLMVASSFFSLSLYLFSLSLGLVMVTVV